MKSLLNKRKRNISCRPVILTAVVCALLAMPLLSSARPHAAGITVTNNSSREILYIYFSPVEQENWGPDQLNNSSLQSGQSVTLTNASCSGAEIKVIAEDRDGCFVSAVVSCAGDAQWTITNETPADCGN